MKISPKDRTVRKWNQHEYRYPEVSIHKKRDGIGAFIKSSDHTGHQVPNDDQITNADPKALDCNSRIEYDRRIGVCDLG